MTIEKIGRLVSLSDIFHIFNKELIFTTYNITTDKYEILSRHTYPDMPCLVALRMSSNIPLIFKPYEYKKNLYIDGGITNNFPVDLGEKYGNNILAINLYSNCNKYNTSNILNYMYDIVSIPINQHMKNTIENTTNKTVIVNLCKNKTISSFNFKLDTTTILDMFSDGYQQTSPYFR